MRFNKSKLYFNSLILSSPGFISIFLSLVAIPLHLNILGVENFGNYIFFHLILSFSFLLSLGIPKSIVIACGKNKNLKAKIAFEGVKYSLYVVLTIIFILLISNNFINYSLLKFNQNYLVFGIIISIIYLVLEGILQAYKKFILQSINNFFFYSLSLSLPSLSLHFFNDLDLDNLILISIFIKFFVIILILIILIKNQLLLKSKEKLLLKTLKKNSLWLSLNSFLVQLYEMLDKYLITLFLGSAALAIYSIPQQLTGKLSVLSRGFGSYLMPFLSSGSKKKDYNDTLMIFYCFIPIIIFGLFPFYNHILGTWLGNNFNNQILSLTKIFSLIAILSSTSHILITRFEAEQLSKKNFKLEIIILPIFVILILIFFYYFKSIIFISLIILIKELILNFLRIFYLKKKLINIKNYLINIILFILLLLFSFISIEIYFILLFLLIFINLKNVIYS